jgi:hypothetical protein
MRIANAFYSQQKKALLLGYFPAQSESMLPGGTVFTCLSHDVVAHELTHAILDGLQEWFVEPTNPDVLAFHEGFADLVALLQRCTYAEVLRHQISRSANLRDAAMLGQLAEEFGQALGMKSGLRNAIGSRDKQGNWVPAEIKSDAYRTELEPHARGEILVGAVFDVFLAIYQKRTDDLIRIATGGSGILPRGAVHPDLVNRLADEAARSARHVLTMCIRAIDYCPPVDITFGDFLRAWLTADRAMVPDDRLNYRVAVIEAFRRRGIYPLDVRTMSEASLIWRPPLQREADSIKRAVSNALKWAQPLFAQLADEVLNKQISTLGELVPHWNLTCDRRKVFDLIVRLQQALHHGFEENPDALRLFGLEATINGGEFLIRALRPIRRQDQNGQSIVELVFSAVQQCPMRWDGKTYRELPKHNAQSRDATFYGGSTVVLNAETQDVRFVIRKKIRSKERRRRWQAYLLDAPSSLAQMYAGRRFMSDEPFAMLHGIGDALE